MTSFWRCLLLLGLLWTSACESKRQSARVQPLDQPNSAEEPSLYLGNLSDEAVISNIVFGTGVNASYTITVGPCKTSELLELVKAQSIDGDRTLTVDGKPVLIQLAGPRIVKAYVRRQSDQKSDLEIDVQEGVDVPLELRPMVASLLKGQVANEIRFGNISDIFTSIKLSRKTDLKSVTSKLEGLKFRKIGHLHNNVETYNIRDSRQHWVLSASVSNGNQDKQKSGGFEFLILYDPHLRRRNLGR